MFPWSCQWFIEKCAIDEGFQTTDDLCVVPFDFSFELNKNKLNRSNRDAEDEMRKSSKADVHTHHFVGDQTVTVVAGHKHSWLSTI
jgi:hypothetical protein